MSEAVEGFGPGFSRNIEAILKVLASGGFYNQGEYRDALRMAGLSLGPDVLPPMPEFQVPMPDDSEDEGYYQDDDQGDDDA